MIDARQYATVNSSNSQIKTTNTTYKTFTQDREDLLRYLKSKTNLINKEVESLNKNETESARNAFREKRENWGNLLVVIDNLSKLYRI